jgi:hypothetical protein
MKPRQRWLIIGGLLLATLAAGFMIDDEPVQENPKRKKGVSAKPVASASAKASPRSSSNNKAAELASTPLSFPEQLVAATAEEGVEGEEKVIDPFRNKSWYVAPPPPPPPKPVAPPLPFQYLGKLSEGGETRVFLHHQGQYLIAKAGDVINGIYRVEEIAGNRMTLLYQPLKEKQVLSIGTEK